MPEVKYKTNSKIKAGYDLGHENTMFEKTLKLLNIPLNVDGTKAAWFRTARDCNNKRDEEIYIYVFYK